MKTAAPPKPRTRYVSCPDCRIRCRYHGHGSKTLHFRCGRCQQSIEVAMTKNEQSYYKWDFEQTSKEIGICHKPWHDFQKRFFKRERREMEIGGKKKKFWVYTDWKWAGYDLMQRIRRYAERHPEIVITGCDDDYHMNSDLVLIPHRFPKDSVARAREAGEYWGTTVLYLCQGATQPTQFFLYPEHEKSLLAALKSVKQHRP